MKRSLGIPLVALAHLVCSWVLFSVSIGIGMKSFDCPHALTSTEKLWTLVSRIMLLPIADPLQRLSKGLTAPIVTEPGYGAGVQSSLLPSPGSLARSSSIVCCGQLSFGGRIPY